MAKRKIFDQSNLPKFVGGTNGWIMPNGELVVFCRVPKRSRVKLPASWDADTELVAKDIAHICIRAEEPFDAYPNRWFDRDFVITGKADPNKDDRARWLVEYWRSKGHEVETFTAKKLKPALVLGVAAEAGKMRTLESGKVTFRIGEFILQCPLHGNVWPVTAATLIDRYDKEGVRPGTPPTLLLEDWLPEV